MRHSWRKLLGSDDVLFSVYRAIVLQGRDKDLLIGLVPKRIWRLSMQVHREIRRRLTQPNKNWLMAECFTTVLAKGEYPLDKLSDIGFKYLPDPRYPDLEFGWLLIRHRRLRGTDSRPLILHVDLPQGVSKT